MGAIAADARKIGVHVSLDMRSLDVLDAAAGRLGLTRSQLLRRMIDDWTEEEQEKRWVAEKAAAALAEDGIPWQEVEARLGL